MTAARVALRGDLPGFIDTPVHSPRIDVIAGKILMDRNAPPGLHLAQALHDRLFVWMTLADDRNLVSAWIAGAEKFKQ